MRLRWVVVGVICALALLIQAAPFFLFRAFIIPTGAMEDTLLIGDRIFVQPKQVLNPKRGDIVVLIYPVDRRQSFIMRVIGVPGDRIRISDKVVYVNGAPQTEPYATHKTEYVDSYRDNFPSNPPAVVVM